MTYAEYAGMILVLASGLIVAASGALLCVRAAVADTHSIAIGSLRVALVTAIIVAGMVIIERAIGQPGSLPF